MPESNDTKETQAAIPQALLNHVIADYKKPADLIGENGMLKHDPAPLPGVTSAL